MAPAGRLDRRTFLRSAALGATSLAVGGGCHGRRGGGPTQDGGGDGTVGVDALPPSQPDLAASPDAGADGALGVEMGSRPEASWEAGTPRPPNLLFILADQWRAQAMGWAGDANARTPVLDGLARESVTFAHAVSCTPVRSLAKQPRPLGIRGRDLSPVLRQEAAADDEPALIMCVSPFGNWSRSLGGREYRGLRTGRFTYVRGLVGPWLLYDNADDPYQLTNLVGRSDYAETQAELDAQLAAKLVAIADPFREAAYYVEQWGYTVDANDGSVPTAYTC